MSAGMAPKVTYTFHFDGAWFDVMVDPGPRQKLDAFEQANIQVRAHGVTDSFAWFEGAGRNSFVLGHNVLMD